MNKRIIVIDDEDAVLNAYKLILSPPDQELSDLKAKAAELKAELFGETYPPSQPPSFPPFGGDGGVGEYEVETARQGEIGYQNIKKAREMGRPFALAFIDIRMPPGLDGIETGRLIRTVDPEIEIVFVTAYSDKDRREIVEKVGMPERILYLKKPFDPEEIRQLALSLTRKWDLERRAERQRRYLEQLINSVRRLKTLNISSIKQVLSAILSEILYFADARKGFIAKVDKNKIEIEIYSDEMTPQELETLSKLVTESDVIRVFSNMKKPMDQTFLSEDLNMQAREFQRKTNTMVLPLKISGGDLFILASDINAPVHDEKVRLLRLLLETSSEVLESVRLQERYIKNEKIATIGQIAAGIIHEINNPLTAVVGAADLSIYHIDILNEFFAQYEIALKNPIIKAMFDNINQQYDPIKTYRKILENFSMIQNGVDQVRNLMDHIRSFSNVGDRFELDSNDITEALENTLVLAHNTLKYGIKVYQNWQKPLIARCDINNLKQVFLNLILNAAQAMNGKGELRITGIKSGDAVHIYISDTGPGIPENIKSRIFEPFYTTRRDGTGLGLSIVKGIIEKHKGSVLVESEVGKGTTFHIMIPA